MAPTTKLNIPTEVYTEQAAPEEVCAEENSGRNSAAPGMMLEDRLKVTAGEFEDKRVLRDQQIAALSMTGPKAPKSKDSWRKTVGKYDEDSPLNRIFDEGAKIREAERIEEC